METLIPGQTYHIYNHANGDDNLFREDENYRFFLQKYEQFITPIANTYAYCLMPNHFHLLVKMHDASTLLKFKAFTKLANDEEKTSKWLSKKFSNLFSAYTQSFNIKYTRKGSLFIKVYKRKTVVSNAQFQKTFLYIHLNPVNHGFTKHEEDWKWSSLNNYSSRLSSNILNMNDAIEKFDSYENIFHSLKEKRQAILSASEADFI